MSCSSLNCLKSIALTQHNTQTIMSVQLKQNNNTVKLNSGASIHQIGLGTWKSTNGSEGYDSVVAALKAGYRHIDTAAIYRNEDQVGKAIRDSGVPREEIFVTTKLWGTQQQQPEKALEQSLQRLGLDYVDLYLMHWPVPLNPGSLTDEEIITIPTLPNGKRDVLSKPTWDFVKTWELMQKLPKEKARAIGVSNFSINNLKELMASPGFKITPAVNQVELHPRLPQDELVQWCLKHDIQMEAYSPLGSTDAPILSEQLILDIAKKLNVSPAQVVISWHCQRGYIVLPKSVTPTRIEANLKTFTLPKDDFNAILNLSKDKGELRVCNPDWSPFVPFV